MLKIKEAIVVEGRYDKIALEPLVDTAIFTTDGFGIFKNKEKLALLRRVAEQRGLIVLTDADGAGLVIRNRLRGAISAQYLKHAYIPDVAGKERRKKAPSRAGTLGVEGMKPEILEEALRRAGAVCDTETRERVTKADLAALGLSGGADSAARRKALQKKLALPENLSANALLDAVNSLYTRDEFLSAARSFEHEGRGVAEQEKAAGGGLKLGGEPVESIGARRELSDM